MNIYQWLFEHEYIWVSGNERFDYYRKGNRIISVPCDIRFPIHVYSIQG